ncbi:serine O-acetyltransferase [Proteus terrae]|uniref:Serine acetyltransferase n=1 Tax=Proteus terrae subsp. cibarius TaxID=626774 RepID=A0A8I0WRP0_9GAMM|nr:serine acetyltransferase [Proteus terrae]MBG2915187.1 serine acetyltransferase [Proteus terrae subsp. cibarius]
MDNYGTLEHLKHCLIKEVIDSTNKPFSWFRVIRRVWLYPERRFNFWWRLSNYFYYNNKHNLANFIHRKIRFKYGCDISPSAKIEKGLTIGHYVGVVITGRAIIGENFNIRQNTTIGIKSVGNDGHIYIGNNVTVGANSCIIGNELHIGDNVMIGAMSFIDKDIPPDRVVFTPKEKNTIIESHIKNNFII